MEREQKPTELKTDWGKQCALRQIALEIALEIRACLMLCAVLNEYRTVKANREL